MTKKVFKINDMEKIILIFGLIIIAGCNNPTEPTEKSCAECSIDMYGYKCFYSRNLSEKIPDFPNPIEVECVQYSECVGIHGYECFLDKYEGKQYNNNYHCRGNTTEDALNKCNEFTSPFKVFAD